MGRVKIHKSKSQKLGQNRAFITTPIEFLIREKRSFIIFIVFHTLKLLINEKDLLFI